MKKEIQISVELQEFMQLHEIASAEKLLEFQDKKLLKMEGFGWRLMREVLLLREIE